MSNEIFADLNKEDFSPEVLRRVDRNLGVSRAFTKGVVTDVACGNGYVGRQLGASQFCDFYPGFEGVVFTNLVEGDSFNNIQLSDTILFFHALEHFANPIDVLHKLKTRLNPEGNIIIFVPNASKNNGHRPWDLSLGHQSQFITETFRNLAKVVDMQVEYLAEVNTFENHEEILCVLKKI